MSRRGYLYSVTIVQQFNTVISKHIDDILPNRFYLNENYRLLSNGRLVTREIETLI